MNTGSPHARLKCCRGCVLHKTGGRTNIYNLAPVFPVIIYFINREQAEMRRPVQEGRPVFVVSLHLPEIRGTYGSSCKRRENKGILVYCKVRICAFFITIVVKGDLQSLLRRLILHVGRTENNSVAKRRIFFAILS